jgi:type III restriction enzyme
MNYTLKPYQDDCLARLEEYFGRAVQIGAAAAFNAFDDLPLKYREVEGLPGLPYVCLRVPTGGGKTVLAAHAVGIACKRFLQAERCVVLWLAPTNAIVDQTLRALRQREHFYREALDRAFGGQVEVLTLREALYVTRATFDGATTVIVSTLAALRVEATEGRKVYETNGALGSHFSGLTSAQVALLESDSSATVVQSLANALCLRRPVVIMDEAHNARTPLSFETLARFKPSCIIEFTATPDQEKNPSNVLFHVSALALKATNMVKLPIRLTERARWQEAVQDAVNKQRQLENIAKEEERETGEYIRPIVLLHAQSRGKQQENVTVDVLRHFLLNDCKVGENEIAEGTSHKWELPENLMDRGCAVRFVLTVAALREGWDCPFAYVLCSVSNLTATGAVEQILGRILRLPRATKKRRDPLNLAYAFATSQGFMESAKGLVDALVDCGFELWEAKQAVEPDPTLPFSTGLDLFDRQAVQVSEKVGAPPQLSSLPREFWSCLSFVPTGVGRTDGELSYTGPPIVEGHANALKAAVREVDRVAIERLVRRTWGLSVAPADLGVPFRVPCFTLRGEEGLELFEAQHEEEYWDLRASDHSLSESEFNLNADATRVADVDIEQSGRVAWRFVAALHEQLSFHDMRGPGSLAELVVWLDRNIAHPTIPQMEAVVWLRALVDDLVERRGLSVPELVVARFRLRDAVNRKLDDVQREAAAGAFQRLLSPEAGGRLQVSPEVCFTFPLNQYPAVPPYRGPIKFNHHYYQIPADMNSEEADCAAFIDNLPTVETWVRNLVKSERFAFWLPTGTDRFWPDFVVKLRDERILVVEYKSERDWDLPDSREKRDIGAVWEKLSEGKCLFVMPIGPDDLRAIEARLN